MDSAVSGRGERMKIFVGVSEHDIFRDTKRNVCGFEMLKGLLDGTLRLRETSYLINWGKSEKSDISNLGLFCYFRYWIAVVGYERSYRDRSHISHLRLRFLDPKTMVQSSPLVRSAFCPMKIDHTSGLTLNPGY